MAALQSQMLEALFEVYFRVLKTCTASPSLLRGGDGDSDPPGPVPGAGAAVGAGGARGGLASTSQPDAAAAEPKTGRHKRREGKGVAGGAGGRRGGADVLAGPAAQGMGLTRERMLKKHPLLYPVLEGLGRYAHLISVEYFNDMMTVFHEV
jgi:nucleolar complex protein 3